MNTQSTSKIVSYIGFAARARKVVFGADSITKRCKRHRLIILCSTAGENTAKQIKSYAEKTNSPLIVLSGCTIEDILKKQNCKVIAITDENLAKAIIENNNA
ncbi:MAG: hypothetical protein RR357_04920 [Clostridia bacterium]